MARVSKVSLRLWGGKLVQAFVLKRRWPLLLLAWRVREWWDDESVAYTKTAWRPVWRVFEDD